MGPNEFTLQEIANRIGGEVRGDPDVRIRNVAPIVTAGEGDITFISNPRYEKTLATTGASAVIVPKGLEAPDRNLLLSENSYLSFAKVVELIFGSRIRPTIGCSPRAIVDPTADIGEDVNLFPGVYVGPGAKVSPGCDLYPGVHIGARVCVGRDSLLHPNVTVLDDCVLGERVILHSGTVIGSDGFGFARDGNRLHKIRQVGNVVVGDDVEMGSNCSVDRAVLGSTEVGSGTKMDNLIQVGHNVVIGPNCTIVSQVGISGSTRIGANTVIAGQVGIGGHIEIGENVEIGARSGVISNIADNMKVLGAPAVPIKIARKAYALFYDIPTMRKEVLRLKKEVEALRDRDES